MNRILSLAICLFGLITIHAQETLPSSEVEVIKDFDARLIEASKLSLNLRYTEPDTSRSFLDKYVLSDRIVKLDYPRTAIKPLAMPFEEKASPYNIYLEGGYGIPKSPFAKGSFYYDGSSFDVEANANFASFQDNDIESKKFSDLNMNLNTNWALNDMLQLNVGGAYDISKRYFYAHELEGPINDSLERKFTNPQFNIGLKNVLNTKSDIDYNVNYQFSLLKDNLNNEEFNNTLNGRVQKSFSEGSVKIGVDIIADLTSLEDTSAQDLNNYFLTPTLGFGKRDWNLKGAVSFGFLEGELNFFPQLEFFYPISSLIMPFVGVRSGAVKNNFYKLTRVNPYIAGHIDTLTNQHFMEYFAGTRGQKDIVQYELRLSYNQTESNALIKSNESDSSKFNILFDDIDIIGIQLESTLELSPELDFTLNFNKYFYKTEQETEAWHKPAMEIHLKTRYTKFLNGQLELNADIYSSSGIYYHDYSLNEAKKLDPVFDMSLGATYHVNNHSGVYLKVNNVFNNKNSRYRHYESIGINPMIGAYFLL